MQRSNGPLIFPGPRNEQTAFAGFPKAWERTVTPALPDVTPHTLRHSYASIADDLGYTEATIAVMLGHSGGGTTRGYIHKLDPALIAAADRVAEHIASLMDGSHIGAEVVPLHRIA
jgi:integrase